METNHVAAERGWVWVKQGWILFTKSPVMWLVLLLIAFGAAVLLSMIPVVGQPLTTLLGPVIMAGLMSGCRALEQEEDLELAHLFSGFQQQTTQLITVGGLSLLGQFLILGLMIGMGASSLIGIMMSDTPPHDPGVIAEAFVGAGAAVLVGLVLFCLLMMAAQFAPMLVYYNRLSPLAAMKLSLRVFFNNIGAMFVYGLVAIVLAILATVPMMLGWIVLIPVMVTSIYACYRDIFPFPDEAVAEQPAATDMEA
ncbi:MAG: hypothetical protein HY799_00790 [Nitrosomonadales bacterium]|nr:hypothetical protein [Nitrosomonadales bacterium]